MAGILKEFLESLSPEEYEQLVGTGNADALSFGFTKKRAVHPGMNGKPVPPPMAQQVWSELMTTSDTTGNKRMAYIHIPFCSHICLYCGFFQNYFTPEKEKAYVERLLKELEMAKRQPRLQEKVIQCVFFGGGTPSCLSPENIARVLQKLKECLPLSNDCEITMEARIHDLVPERMEAWFANGVNRVSIGVQSFDTKIRQASGRIDDRETVIERLKQICAYDQAAIIVDIIFGLPGQDTASFIKDLETIDSLPISGMDLYQLNLWDASPMKKAIDKGNLPPAATRAEQARMFAAAENWLNDRAYKRLSNCHWSKDIRERSMYNIMAKIGSDIIPFGCGAGGAVGDYSMMLMRDINKYQSMIDEGKKPIMFMGGKSPYAAVHSFINENMEQGVFNLKALVAKYGPELQQLEILLDKWCMTGLMSKGDAIYFQTQAGRFWQNNLNQSLLEAAEYILTDGASAKKKKRPDSNAEKLVKGLPSIQKGSSMDNALSHPGGKPAGHPSGMPMGHPGGKPGGHPAGMPMGHSDNAKSGEPPSKMVAKIAEMMGVSIDEAKNIAAQMMGSGMPNPHMKK